MNEHLTAEKNYIWQIDRSIIQALSTHPHSRKEWPVSRMDRTVKEFWAVQYQKPPPTPKKNGEGAPGWLFGWDTH